MRTPVQIAYVIVGRITIAMENKRTIEWWRANERQCNKAVNPDVYLPGKNHK
jgi:hypothetical protein